MHLTADQQLLKRLNRAHLMRRLQRSPGLSRAQLAQTTGLTKSTVGLLVRELIEEGWLTAADTTQVQGLGRPSTPLSFDRHNRLLLGVEIAIGAVRVVASSLEGKLLVQTQTAFDDSSVTSVCGLVAKLVAELVADLQAQAQNKSHAVAGMGLGLPGAYDAKSGMLHFAPNLAWRNVPFAQELQKALQAQGLAQLDLYIQNEADTAALSEYEFVAGRQDSSLIFVNCNVGVGAGIVLNDELFTGSQGMAGEIGHSILQPDGLVCSCGRRGCAETLFGLRALEQGRTTPKVAGHYLGLALQNVWTTFNPATLVLGGWVCQQYPDMVESATATLAQTAALAQMEPPRVQLAHYGLWAAAVGAAALVLHHVLRPLRPSTRSTTCI